MPALPSHRGARRAGRVPRPLPLVSDARTNRKRSSVTQDFPSLLRDILQRIGRLPPGGVQAGKSHCQACSNPLQTARGRSRRVYTLQLFGMRRRPREASLRNPREFGTPGACRHKAASQAVRHSPPRGISCGLTKSHLGKGAWGARPHPPHGAGASILRLCRTAPALGSLVTVPHTKAFPASTRGAFSRGDFPQIKPPRGATRYPPDPKKPTAPRCPTHPCCTGWSCRITWVLVSSGFSPSLPSLGTTTTSPTGTLTSAFAISHMKPGGGGGGPGRCGGQAEAGLKRGS